MPDYRSFLLDPTAASKSNASVVLKVTYKAGAWSPNAAVPGGMLFHAYPFGKGTPIAKKGVTFSYDVYFPPDFDFIKGGKLPGLAGGSQSCGGGTDPAHCWSARVMWRKNGEGEGYLYAPRDSQASDFCSVTKTGTRTICNNAAGVSFQRGAFKFVPGTWHSIQLTVLLNTPGKTNGVFQLDVNGVTAIRYTKMNWRLYAGVYADSLYMASWFGGSDVSWAPTATTYALFKNFALYSHDSGNKLPIQSITSQTTLTVHIDEPE